MYMNNRYEIAHLFVRDILIKISIITGNPGSVIVPQYGSSKITVFVWGKNTILKFLGNTKIKINETYSAVRRV